MRRIRIGGVVLAVIAFSLLEHPLSAAALLEAVIVIVPIGLLLANGVSYRWGDARISGIVQVTIAVALCLLIVVGLGYQAANSLWVLLALPIAEGALRWGLAGAMQVWAAVLPLYILAWSWAFDRYGMDPVDLQAIAYRAGMLLMLGAVTGALSEHLHRQADALLIALRESERRAELLRTVAATGRRLPSDDLPSLLDAVAAGALGLGFEVAELSLIDAARQVRITAAQRGLPPGAIPPAREGDGGVVGQVWRTGSTVVVGNYSVWAGADADVLPLGLREVVGVPVWVSGRVEGVLCAGWRHERSATSDEVECLEMLALEAGAALASARRLEDQAAYAEQLHRQARHDSLTGLANRAQLIEAIQNRGDAPCALLFVDLDRFKHVNDTFGHAGGDQLLRTVAARMGGAIRPPDVLARFGGDEFVVLLRGADELAAVRVAERLHESLEDAFFIYGRSVHITASIGVTEVPPTADSHLALVQADVAMFAAKGGRRPRTAVHDERLHRQTLRRVRIEVDLQGLENRDELSLVYQPLYLPDADTVAGAEALLRWSHPELGEVGPAEFVPLAERSDCLRQIGWWALETACTQLALWRVRHPEFCLWVNVSPGQVTEPGFASRLATLLERLNLSGEALVLELTESPLEADDVGAARTAMNDLHRLGIRLVADDFGQESSSLGRLRELPFDGIKIDRALLDAVPTSPDQFAVVRSITELAHDLRMEVVAEGVERFEQIEALRLAGCDLLQGFELGRPMASDLMTDLLATSPALHNTAGKRVARFPGWGCRVQRGSWWLHRAGALTSKSRHGASC